MKIGKKAKAEAAAASASQNLLDAAALKLQQDAAADRFRGTHLDPKAHHWDDVSCLRCVVSDPRAA